MSCLRGKSIAFIHFTCIAFIIWDNSSYATIGTNVGFYCNDTNIQKPFSGDSISVTQLFSTLLVGTPIVIYFSEYLLKKDSKEDIHDCKGSSSKLHLKYYYSGFLYVLSVTELLKFAITELRPHFIFTCQPQIGQMKCSDGLITNFNCTGTGPSWLVDRDIYKSFPSGHAALSFYTFIFLTTCIFLSLKNVTKTTVTIWKIFVPVLFLAWTIVCCVSRLLDNRHFWWDVLFGVVLGLIGGIIMSTLSVYKVQVRGTTKRS